MASVGMRYLLVGIFLVTNLFAQSMPPGGRAGGIGRHDSTSYTVPGCGTNLWLSINLSNDAVHLLLHNTQPGVPYLIQSRESLASGSWFCEETVTGAIAGTATPATLNAGQRTNSLFIQALTWMTNAASGATATITISGERIMELTGNGDVVSWGGNYYGEFGDYTFLDSSNPVHVVGLTNIIKIAAGLNHSLALDANGTLWAWGQNNVGQLGVGGDGYEGDTNIPVPVTGMTNVIALAANGYIAGSDGEYGLSLAVEADGTVWMWGSGDGYWVGRSPTQIAGISNVNAAAVGAVHALALKPDGTVWAWGNNYLGQLGDGTKNESDIAKKVMGLSKVVSVCAGDYHSLALDANGNVWAWGFNAYGQLGDGGAEWESEVPVRVSGLTNVVVIAAGANHSLALDGGGQLWAWGDDEYEQLGDGGVAYDANLPMQVVGMTNIISIAAGTHASVAVDGNGNVWQWGQGIARPYGPSQEWGDENGHPRQSPAYIDFYNSQLPNLEIVNGDNQLHHASSEFEQPLVIRTTDSNGVALSNAPVSVEVVAGDMELRTASSGENYKGLRLTTDANGEAALIGYADEYANNPNCRVRVLVASRERVGEVDFNEMIVPRPAISITSPADGSVCLVGANQSLTLSVNAQAAPGVSVQEVDYSCEINGESRPVGFSTQSPFSFVWTNTLWWTNAFVGQYLLSAVALDSAGGWSDAQSVTITVALDSDGDGMPDYWQLQYFGRLGVDPNADPDGDGISNLQEYQNGSSPTDYYNGNLPHLELLSGNDQAGNYDSFLPQPVSIKVSGSQSMANAPVTFTVTNGTALLAATTNDTPVTSLTLWTDANGQVSAWAYIPPAGSNAPDSTIVVSASSEASSTALTVHEFVPLGHWTFNDTNTWMGEGGQWPLLAANVAGIPSWSGNAALMDGSNPVQLAYNIVDTNGNANITCQTGSLLFWFRPDWSSANVGGNGPGVWGRLIEMGSYNDAFTSGWWALYLSPDGDQLLFGTSTNGGGMTNLTANVSWCSNEWYQVALTYSPTDSALYVDGQLLAKGAGVTYCPDAGGMTNGFRIGSDQDGNNQAAGAFDELESFDYPLAAADAYTHGSDVPDWWEVKYFDRVGMDPNFTPANDGYTLLTDYERALDPNVINFTMSVTNSYVNNSTVPVQINIANGIPSYMAVVVNTTNIVVVPNQLCDLSSNFIAALWQPYNSNIVVSLSSGGGDYYVWVGLRGLPPDAEQTWHGTRLTLDAVPPVLTITNPVAGVVSKPVMQLQGCANESLSSLTYDVSNATGVITNQTGYVTGHFCDTNLLAITTNYFQCYNVTLTSNGINLITLHAADLAGNAASTNIAVTFDVSADTNPPALTILWPQGGTSISGSNFTLQAQVSDPMATVMASIVDTNGDTNMAQGLVEQGGLVWVQNLPLARGANTLTVTATDLAGNTSVTNLTLFQGSVIVTMNPLAGDQLNQSSVSVSGTISDPSYTLTVNGVSATVHSDGTWEADNVPARSSGTAIFDVEVFSGSAPDLVHANLGIPPMDAPAGGNAGSQLFAATLPVKVGLMSYLMKEAPSSGLIEGGGYCAVDPCCGTAFGNTGDTINWTYQAGGFDGGYDYSSGYFNSPPGSPGWIMVSQPGYGPWGIPLPAGEDAYAAPWENVSDAQHYVRARVMIEPQGQAAAGTIATYLVQAQVNGGQPPNSTRIQGVPLMDDGAGSGYMLLTAPAGVNVDVTPETDGNYTFNVQAYRLGLLLAVDNNRDGQINVDSSDATTQINPYRFWLNDSKEHGDDESSEGEADDQIPESNSPNHHQGQVNGNSDLVNFFPMVLCLSNTLQLLPPSSGYEYHLVQDDGAVKFVYTSLTPTDAFDYLTNTASAGYGADLMEWSFYADTIQATTVPGAVLDTNWLAQVQANGGMGVILAEGCAATTRPLWLEIWRNGKPLAGTPLYLSITGVEQMFRHVNFCYVNGTVTVPARAEAPNEPQTNGKNLVFLHGYNVNQQEARGVESEMFKRFYWSGSKAKFYGVTWNGAESKGTIPFGNLFTPNYHTNVVNALETASPFAAFLGNLSGQTVVAAHSLGNMVVLSAINDYNAAPSKYFMIDAAIPMEAIQSDMGYNPNMLYSTWNSYADRLFASDWWQLFPTSDARSTLTWSNRVGNLRNVDVYNFYSSGEEVLREYDSDPPSTVLGGVGTELLKLHIWDDLPFGIYAWVWQEKGKGACSQDWFIGSSHGGWRFSYYWRDSFGNPLSASIMNDTQNSILQYQPMFSFASSPNGPPDEDLLGEDASAYAQANRDRILSDAIPALTLPVGANWVRKLAPLNSDDKNFDMQEEFESSWPSARTTGGEAYKWHHSDFDYVAYPFTYKLFNQIVTFGNLK